MSTIALPLHLKACTSYKFLEVQVAQKDGKVQSNHLKMPQGNTLELTFLPSTLPILFLVVSSTCQKIVSGREIQGITHRRVEARQSKHHQVTGKSIVL